MVSAKQHRVILELEEQELHEAEFCRLLCHIEIVPICRLRFLPL